MIPSNEEIYKRLSKTTINSTLLNGGDYFKLVEEYTELQKVFDPSDLISKIMIWVEMIVQPLYTIVQAIISKDFQLFSLLSLNKSITLWKDWFRWKELEKLIREWVRIVRSIGGPFISTNDASYHMYVYADAMQRIQNTLLTVVAEKRTKCL